MLSVFFEMKRRDILFVWKMLLYKFENALDKFRNLYINNSCLFEVRSDLHDRSMKSFKPVAFQSVSLKDLQEQEDQLYKEYRRHQQTTHLR